MTCTIELAYQILEFEDPILFQNKILDLYISRIDSEPQAKENFLLLRRTGKTTYYAVEAAISLLSGKDVFFYSKTNEAEIDSQIKNYLHKIINHIGSNNIYMIGRLKVERVKSSNKSDVMIDVIEKLVDISSHNYYAIFDLF